MEGQERSDDLRASRSWEVVHRMPAQADAAQGEPEDKQAQEGACSSVEKILEAKEGDAQLEGVTAAKEDHDWVLGDSEDPAVTDLECFEGEAEVLQDSHKDTGLRFEEEGTCVHASKPSSDAVDAVEYDSASEGDPEASSLAGSDCDYAFVLDHPKMRLPDADKDIDTHPVKGRSMPQAQPSPELSPPRSPQRALRSRSVPGRVRPVLQAARSGSRSPAQNPALPSPALSCTEKAHLKAVVPDTEQFVCYGEMAALGAAAAAAAEEEAEDTSADTGPVITDCLGAQQAGGGGAAWHGHETRSREADRALSRHASGEYANPDDTLSRQRLSDGTDEAETGCSVQPPSLVQTAAAEIARQRRSQLDAVGVIPGGRAAFGAKLPTYGSCTAGGCAGASGRQVQQEVQADRPVRAAMPELARPAAPDWARQRKRGTGGAGGGAPGQAPAASKLLQRLLARPAGAAQSEGRRRLEVWALAGSPLECYDSLWHGSSGIMASQS